MELILKRIAKKKNYTIGKLYISPKPSDEGKTETTVEGNSDNNKPTEEYICDTLEPRWRDYKNGAYKIKGKSAIPEGRYAVVVSWSPRMKQWLPILLGVPMFSGIRIHAGNTANDTEGCILVGQNLKVGMVLNSRIWLNRVKKIIVEAKNRDEAVWITIE